MCGIIGRLTLNPSKVLKDDTLGLMMRCLRHRGPDGEGFYDFLQASHPSNSVRGVFGHRRLKVIDLAPEADQPMQNAGCVQAGRAQPLVIVFNGEIYNYKELTLELNAKGHHFQSHSDTEVILHLYEEHGIVSARSHSFTILMENSSSLHRSLGLFSSIQRLSQSRISARSMIILPMGMFRVINQLLRVFVNFLQANTWSCAMVN